MRNQTLTLTTRMNSDQIRDHLAQLHQDEIALAAAKTNAVARARKLGLSWEQIARPLDITKQGAWDQWRHLG